MSSRKSILRNTFGIAGLLAIAMMGCTSTGSSTTGTSTSSSRAPAGPSDAEADERSTSDEHLDRATALGREIHRRDMFAWWSSDVVMPLIGPEDAERMRGWVLDALDPGAVHFVAEIDGALRTFLLVRCDETGPASCEVERPSPPPPLSERNRAQHHALVTASQHPEFVPTSDRYNHVVLPADEGWSVYLIAATLDPNLVVLGRHYRFLVSADGEQVLEWRAFSESALVLDRRNVPAGAEAAAMVVSHLLDDTPTELHVWAALNYRTPLGVVTRSGSMWMIDPTGAITRVE